MQKSKRRQSGAGQWRSLVPLAAISSGILLVVASIIGLIGYEAPYITRGLLQLHVGDVVRLGSEAEGTPFPTMDVRAVVVSAPGLAPGSICSLGMGGAAGGGGTLVILRYEPAQYYIASWAGTGRSTREGQDCGHSAELRISVEDVQGMQLAPILASVTPATV